MEEKESILKSKFFLKLFGVPSSCWIMLTLIFMIMPSSPGDEPITWIDFFTENFEALLVWFVISFIITLVIKKFINNNTDNNLYLENVNNDYIVKSGFFLKLFAIPVVLLAILLIIGMIPDEAGDVPVTFPELITSFGIILIIWFAISFVIVLICNEIKKKKPKKKNVENSNCMTKSDEKIAANLEEKDEEIKDRDKVNKKKKNDKCLYTCESIINGYEYKRMAKYFPNRMYWVFVLYGTFMNIFISAIVAIVTLKWSFTLVFFILYEMYIMIIYKVRLEDMSEKVFNKRDKRGIIDKDIENEFYDDYLIQKGKSLSLTINYSDICKCVETDTNFYLEYPQRNMIVILQKNTCDLELVNFIRKKFENIENSLGKDIKFSTNKPKRRYNSSFIKIFMIVLFVMTLFSLYGAFMTFVFANEIIPQDGLFGFVKNAWVGWLWLPIPLLSIILGFRFRKVENIIIGFIMGFLLLMFGTISFTPTFSEDYSKIYDYKDILNVELPSNGSLTIQNWDSYFDNDKTDYKTIYAIYSNEDVSNLVESIHDNSNWILSTEIETKLKLMIPLTFSSGEDVYYSIYNKTTNEYNLLPSEEGEYEVYAMKYDESNKMLEIHEFKYSYK